MSAQPHYRYDIFISHSPDDETFVHNTLLPHLEEAELRVSVERDFLIGLPTVLNLEQIVKQSRYILFVLTPASLVSEWADMVSQLVRHLDPAARQRRLWPLILEQCELPPLIAQLTYVDFTNPTRRSIELNRLVQQFREAIADDHLSAPHITKTLMPNNSITVPLARTSDSVQARRDQLSHEMKRLVHEIEAVGRKLLNLSNPTERSLLEEQRHRLWLKMEEIQEERDALQHNFQADLPKINFTAAKDAIKYIVDKPDGCATMLLLQHSSPMRGDLCLKAVRQEWDGRDLREYPVKLADGGSLDEYGILLKLGAYLGLHIRGSSEEYAQAIIQTLCDSVRSGTIVYIELQQCDYLPQSVFTWFLDHFWQPLVEEIPHIAQTYLQVKFIIALVAAADLPLNLDHSATSLCSNYKDFESGQALDLQLKHWTKLELKDWLVKFGRKTGAEVDRLTDMIYRISKNGEPQLVARELENHFDR